MLVWRLADASLTTPRLPAPPDRSNRPALRRSSHASPPSAGNAVSGATGISCADVAGTSGAATTYRGSIPKTVAYNIDYYDVRATITDTSGNVKELNLSVPAQDG